jgi:hypothetical protein
MATAKQVAANRANAARSTGPRTPAGQAKSSRNAFRHGLSLPLPWDLTTATEIARLALAIAGENPCGQRLMAASEFAAAQCELMRIRALRFAAMLPLSATIDPRCLRWVLGFDRYEHAALSRRTRAAKTLDRLEVGAAVRVVPGSVERNLPESRRARLGVEIAGQGLQNEANSAGIRPALTKRTQFVGDVVPRGTYSTLSTSVPLGKSEGHVRNARSSRRPIRRWRRGANRPRSAAAFRRRIAPDRPANSP